MKEKNVAHHILGEDTAVGNIGMTKGKARALGGMNSHSRGGLSVIGATKRGGLAGLDVVFLGENFEVAI